MDKKRIQAKRPCLNICSHISLDESSQEDPIDIAANYIQNLEERVHILRQKRDFEKLVSEIITEVEAGIGIPGNQFPVVKMNHMERELQIILLSNITRRLRFSQVVCLIEREGVEMTDGTHNVIGDKIIYFIRCEASPEIDYDALLMDKLKALVE